MLVPTRSLPLTGPSLQGPAVQLFFILHFKDEDGHNVDLYIISTVISRMFLYNLSDPHQV